VGAPGELGEGYRVTDRVTAVEVQGSSLGGYPGAGNLLSEKGGGVSNRVSSARLLSHAETRSVIYHRGHLVELSLVMVRRRPGGAVPQSYRG
jgi:hypothetical protein